MRRVPLSVLLLVPILLAASPTRAQTLRPQPPRVDLWVARDAAPGPKVRLRLNARNVPEVTLVATPVDGRAWLLRRDRDGAPRRPELLPAVGPARPLGTIRLRPRGERSVPGRIDDYRSRQVNLPALPPGVWRVAASGGGARAVGVVNVTHLAVVAHRAPDAALVWVTDHRTGRAVPGARVDLHAPDGRSVARATADRDGVARLAAAPAASQTLVVAAGGDLAGLTVGTEDPDGRLVAHVATDRPVYRPGQRVSFRAILRATRGQGYVPIADGPVRLEVRDPREVVLERRDLVPTAMGTVSGTVDLPSEIATGPCTIVLVHRGRSAYATFAVAAYRKPEFTASAVPERPRYLSGEKGAFTVTARTFFGAPLVQAEVRWRIRRAPLDLPDAPGDDPAFFAGGDGNLYPSDAWRADPFVAEGVATTGADGVARIPFTAAPDMPDALYRLEATVTDSQNRPGDASAAVPVYGAALRLGLRPAAQCVALGTAFPVEVRALDRDGRPRAATVALTVRRQVWDSKLDRWVRRDVGQAGVRVPESGRATVRLPASAEGDLEIVARAADGTGRTARASTSVWVAGPDLRPEREEPQVRVRLDRRVHALGDTAVAYVTPASPDRPTLVTLQGAGLFRHVVLPPGRGTRAWRIPVDRALSPNAFVDAQQWSAPARLLSASATLAVPDPSKRLQVSVRPERDAYRPGETVRGTVRLADAAGRPVRGEVALAVVDEALYAVRPDATPDPLRTFWGLRPNAVRTFQSAPEELSGGAFQRANGELAPLRSRFVDTAHWDAHLQTGADGVGTFSFEAPGNLTRWRFTAIGVTRETTVGRGVGTALASRDATLRLATPRQAVAGDRWRLVGTVDNRAARPRRFTVALADPAGLTLHGPSTHALTVPAGGQGRVAWDVSVDVVPAGGSVSVGGVLTDDDAPGDPERGDRLRVSFAALPAGVVERRVASARLDGDSARLDLPLPAAPGPPASVRVEAQASLTDAAVRDARAVLGARPDDPEDAADTIAVAAAARDLPGVAPSPGAVRDAVALLARTQNADGGWGAWEDAPSDPWVSARVVTALAALRAVPGTLFPELVWARARAGAERLFAQTDSWEARAWLADALRAAEHPKAAAMAAEVARRGVALSPYARALLGLGPEAPETVPADVDPALAVSGARPGWRASPTRTLAASLAGKPADAGRALARALAFPQDVDGAAWRSRADRAAAATALAGWLREHPEPQAGTVRLSASVGDGTFVALGDDGAVELPVDPRAAGSGVLVRVRRDSGVGEAFVAATLRVARAAPAEEGGRMRLLRRVEALLPDGVWRDLADDVDPGRARWSVRPGDLVRVTLALWPSDRTRLASVAQVLPAGFEVVEREEDDGVRADERDGRLLWRTRCEDGAPVTLRCVLRAEAEGVFTLNPARAENLLSPSEGAVAAPFRLRVGPRLEPWGGAWP